MAHSNSQNTTEQNPLVTLSDNGIASNKDVAFNSGANVAKDIVFGSIAGVVGKVIEFPFDTIKVRLQSQPDTLPLRYSGPLDCFRQSLRQDGIAGLYRGISPPLFGAAVETSSLFFSYNLAQGALRSAFYPTQDLPFAALGFCGAISGAFTSILLTPIELVKCKMQVPAIQSHGEWRAPTVTSVIASVYKHQGIMGLWHGQMGTLIRETGGSAAWFGSYEGLKILMRRQNPKIKSDDDLPLLSKMLAGAVAGMSYNFIFYPADTIKSRMQTEDVSQVSKTGQRTFWSVARATWSHHGLAGLYRGCGITVFRAAPSSAFIFTIYEALKKQFP
ncbi:mitochondrial carrier [Microthyrium microscopicum]|uniref:Mitochondrial carrier n=1 Tax=Microthyrium microscopicum TaxID=703497 RepID=A0A6A6UTX5_9PEZI|nr:mitochondrial carrier [Microthyrium microscopicum]